MRFWASSVAASFVVLACSSGGTAPCTLVAIGKACTLDTDCCTGYCFLYDSTTGARCQETPNPPQACAEENAFCTQDRNCCSGLCQNGACFAGSGGNSCLSIGSTCIQSDSCCSNDCVSDGQGHTACIPQPQSDGGPGCGLPGDGCNDPSQCCFGVCGPQGACMGSTGGGGPSCGQSGAQCLYGSDCCSGQCAQLSSTSACR